MLPVFRSIFISAIHLICLLLQIVFLLKVAEKSHNSNYLPLGGGGGRGGGGGYRPARRQGILNMYFLKFHFSFLFFSRRWWWMRLEEHTSLLW